MKIWLENILRFFVLLLLQVLLFNNLQFLGLCIPYIFILFLILLPPTLPRWVEILVGFICGLILDVFTNSLGVQMAACTLVSYLRPLLIMNMIQDNDRLIATPSSITLGRTTFYKIVLILVVLHHTMMFSLIAFSIHNWWITLIQIIVSSLFTTVFIIVYDFLNATKL